MNIVNKQELCILHVKVYLNGSFVNEPAINVYLFCAIFVIIVFVVTVPRTGPVFWGGRDG